MQSVRGHAHADRREKMVTRYGSQPPVNRNRLKPFRITNIIAEPSLDIDIYPKSALTTYPSAKILVFDPGEMVGWAALIDQPDEYSQPYIEVGQAEWHQCRNFAAERIFIERTPYAARRTFDAAPMHFTGIVLGKMHPRQPSYVLPTSLKVAARWFSLPRGHGLGPHAKDALAHLVYVMVTKP